MEKEKFKDLIRPIVYKYGSGWLLDKPDMLLEVCEKYHSEQLLIHSVSNWVVVKYAVLIVPRWLYEKKFGGKEKKPIKLKKLS